MFEHVATLFKIARSTGEPGASVLIGPMNSIGFTSIRLAEVSGVLTAPQAAPPDFNEASMLSAPHAPAAQIDVRSDRSYVLDVSRKQSRCSEL